MVERHRLSSRRRADRVDTVADDLVGLHSSDPVTVYLSLHARLDGATIESIERALYEDRSVVRHHAMRRTLWVFTPEHARLAHASTTLGLVGPQRRALVKLLAENEVADDADRWLDEAFAAVAAVLREVGEATARELGERVPSLRAGLSYAPDKPYGGTISAHTRVLVLMGFMGRIVRARPLGTWVSGQYRWAETDRWLAGGFGSDEPATAASQLVDRYLRSFGPASPVDVQWWTGWAKRATTNALAACRAIEVAGQRGEPLYVAEGDTAKASTEPSIALLPGLDPTVMGWKERDWYLPPERAATVFDRNGNAGPCIVADGSVVGGWAQRDDGTIVTSLHAPLSSTHRRMLDEEIERLRGFVGDSRFTIRFPSPLSRHLAS